MTLLSNLSMFEDETMRSIIGPFRQSKLFIFYCYIAEIQYGFTFQTARKETKYLT